jgi:small subunit ribosomal protein S18
MARTMRRKKVCPYVSNPSLVIDYKNPKQLRQHLTEGGKIVPRRITGVSAKYQRQIAKSIKLARQLALLPYTASES